MAGRGRGRGRQRKPRESRMDAAVDAMKAVGFEEKLIKQTVRELLKVYGGADAWPLIEDGCYSTLLEILLKKNEEGDIEGGTCQSRNEGANQEQPMALEQFVDATPIGNAEPTNDAEPPFSEVTDNDASGTDNTGMEESLRGDVNVEAPVINSDVLGAMEGSRIDLNLEAPVINSDVLGAMEESRIDLNLEAPVINPDVHLENTHSDLPPVIVPPQPPVITKRRRPFHGWISDDDDEDTDGILYLPTRGPAGPIRRSRWDG